MVYRHNQPLRRQKSLATRIFNWSILVVVILTIIGIVYVADYCDMMDVPFFDKAHDRKAQNGS